MNSRKPLKLIGLSGKAGTGKSTVAEKIVQQFKTQKQSWIRMSFADLLRSEVAEKFKLEPSALRMRKTEFVYSPHHKKLITIRELLQCWGTGYRRKSDPEYWVKAMARRIKLDRAFRHAAKQKPAALGVVIDDVRFPNEANWILEEGGYLIRLAANPNWWEPGTGAGHESETALDDFPDFHENVFLPKGDKYTTDFARILVNRLQRLGLV